MRCRLDSKSRTSWRSNAKGELCHLCCTLLDVVLLDVVSFVVMSLVPRLSRATCAVLMMCYPCCDLFNFVLLDVVSFVVMSLVPRLRRVLFDDASLVLCFDVAEFTGLPLSSSSRTPRSVTDNPN